MGLVLVWWGGLYAAHQQGISHLGVVLYCFVFATVWAPFWSYCIGVCAFIVCVLCADAVRMQDTTVVCLL